MNGFSTNRVTLVAAMVLALQLTVACGGGSSQSDHLLGTFIDSQVAGVTYRTATQSGTTDSNGRFRYQVGESITFSLGDLELGTTDATPEVTVFDLVAEIDAIPTEVSEFYKLVYTGSRPGPMQRAVNIAVLLQSLDRDSNPDNGIDIPTEVGDLVKADEIDLGSYTYDFHVGGNERDGRGLLGLLRAAAAINALSPRQAVNPQKALNHALAEAGFDRSISLARSFRQDVDVDGNMDTHQFYTYDVDGRLTNQSFDNDNDGISDQVREYTYVNGKNVRYSRDDGNDGVLEDFYLREYNEYGQLTRFERRNDQGDTTELQLSTYDTEGRMIFRERTTPNSHVIQRWIVDANGRRSTYELDTDGDGTIDRRDLLAFGEQTRDDHWVERDIDDNMDGLIDTKQTRSFDEFGRLLTNRTDSDLDGVADSESVTVYADIGITQQRVLRSDGSGYEYRYSYDSAGNLIQFTGDNDLDGTFERTTDYGYDAQGNRTSQNSDNDGDGIYDTRYSTTYDAAGKQLSWESDHDGDGQANTRQTYEYDAQGRRVASNYDRGADGSTDVYSEWSDWIEVPFGAFL